MPPAQPALRFRRGIRTPPVDREESTHIVATGNLARCPDRGRTASPYGTERAPPGSRQRKPEVDLRQLIRGAESGAQLQRAQLADQGRQDPNRVLLPADPLRDRCGKHRRCHLQRLRGAAPPHRSPTHRSTQHHGSSSRNAMRTVFLKILNHVAITLIGNLPARCNRGSDPSPPSLPRSRGQGRIRKGSPTLENEAIPTAKTRHRQIGWGVDFNVGVQRRRPDPERPTAQRRPIRRRPFNRTAAHGERSHRILPAPTALRIARPDYWAGAPNSFSAKSGLSIGQD